ncbi:MAG: hypothetical protein BGO78_17765 [Chloroflexi bacterium 44-23]|nr:MAG: hypothetical protein BGO78_17765 [Chloroflexi bacterium 44-23]
MSRIWPVIAVFWLFMMSACNPDASVNVPTKKTNEAIIITTTSFPYSTQIATETRILPTHTRTATISSTRTLEPAANPSSTTPAMSFSSNDTTKPFLPIFNFPISENYNQTIDSSYRYGTTQNGARLPHDGVEFYNEYGTPVIAALNGTVVFAGSDEKELWGRFKDYYGNMVIIEHSPVPAGPNFYSLYAHLSKINVRTGEVVSSGHKIGEVGFSGGAIGSHLHFEVRVGQPLLANTSNPELYLPLGTDASGVSMGILAGRILDASGLIVEDAGINIQAMRNDQVDPDQIPTYLTSYTKGMPLNTGVGENFVISNLEEGEYRLTVYISGSLQERFVRVFADQITFITIQPKN